MSYFSNITNAVGTLIAGMKVTMGYFVRPREHVTLQYPDEVWPIPSRNIGVGELDSYNTIRSKLTVNIDDCIGCKACERACPVNCIHIDTYKGGPDEDLGTTSNGTKIKLLTASFIIDMSECMFCDLCTPPCPEDCITMTPDYQFISNDNLKKDVTPEQRWRDKDLLIYQFSKVSEEERQARKAEAEEAAKAKAIAMAEKKAAAEQAAIEKAAKEAAEAEAARVASEEAAVVAEQDVEPTSETHSEASGWTIEAVQTEPETEIETESTDPEQGTASTLDETESVDTVNVDIPIETITRAETPEEPAAPVLEPPVTEKPADPEDSAPKESENG